MGIEFYRGYGNISELLSNEENIVKLFVENANKSYINGSLSDLQTKLLEVCPFKGN